MIRRRQTKRRGRGGRRGRRRFGLNQRRTNDVHKDRKTMIGEREKGRIERDEEKQTKWNGMEDCALNEGSALKGGRQRHKWLQWKETNQEGLGRHRNHIKGASISFNRSHSIDSLFLSDQQSLFSLSLFKISTFFWKWKLSLSSLCLLPGMLLLSFTLAYFCSN